MYTYTYIFSSYTYIYIYVYIYILRAQPPPSQGHTEADVDVWRKTLWSAWLDAPIPAAGFLTTRLTTIFPSVFPCVSQTYYLFLVLFWTEFRPSMAEIGFIGKASFDVLFCNLFCNLQDSPCVLTCFVWRLPALTTCTWVLSSFSIREDASAYMYRIGCLQFWPWILLLDFTQD